MTVLELLDALGVPYVTSGHEHARRGWAQVDCPRCSPGWRHYRLGINLRFGYATCWACGYLPMTSVLQELSARPWGEVKRLLEGLDSAKAEPEAARGTLVLPKGLGPLLPAHVRYLEGRGFDAGELARTWGLQGIGLAGRLAWRIFIPITVRGQTVSWTTRATADNIKKRYHSAEPHEETVNHRDLLYGEDLVPGHAVAALEGPPDVWRTGPGAVCTFGTAYTKAQVLRLSRYPIRCVCFDAEPAAQRRAQKLVRELECFAGRTLAGTLEWSKDPGSATEREINQLRGILS